MKRGIICLLLLCLWAAWTYAADTNTVRFKFKAIGSEAFSGLCYQNYPDGLEQPPVFASMGTVAVGFSREFEYTGPATIRFFQRKKDDETPRLLASFDTKRLKNGCVFVFFYDFTDTADKPILQIIPVNDMGTSCSDGEIVFYNFSKIPLAGSIGKNIFRPVPARTQPLKGFNNFRMEIYSLWTEQNKVVPVCIRTMSLSKGFRYFGFFYPEFKKTKNAPPAVRVRFIVEMLDEKLIESLMTAEMQ